MLLPQGRAGSAPSSTCLAAPGGTGAEWEVWGFHMASAAQCEVLLVLTGCVCAFGQCLLGGRFCCE